MDKNLKVFDLDLNRCVGCYACVVACMDQNDIYPDDEIDIKWRDISVLNSSPIAGKKISYISLSCMHCNDAPCVIGCPTGALKKDEFTGMVVVDPSNCIGCHSCLMSCPFGAPKFGSDGIMQKCKGCIERVENGLIPACVRICPTKALKFDTVENIENSKKQKLLRKAIDL